MKMVTILMSTYNGEKYLKEQIDSLLKQKNVKIKIFVRDDGSTDKTTEILDQYKRKKLLEWYSGENKKSALSFFDLLKKAPKSDYYAFCDQDDYWLDDKLCIALEKLSKFDNNKPCLYYGRPRLVDSKLNYIKNPKSSMHSMISFRESIINSNATGCTMVFNYKLLCAMKKNTPNYIYMHDNWLHKLCLILKGNVFFDKDVHILYRQHENNVIGINNSFIKKIKKKLGSLLNKDRSRSKIIKSLYEEYSYLMSPEDKRLALLVVNYDKNFLNRLKLFFCFKIRTKYFFRNLYFRIAVLLKAF